MDIFFRHNLVQTTHTINTLDITDLTPHSIIVDDIKLFIVQHVETYDFVGFNTHHLTFSPANEVSHYYFVIDLLLHDAFGHWVYESAVYLTLFKKLKTRHFSNLKLLLKGAKVYKTLFLQYFNIPATDVCYKIESGNVCVFPSPITSLNDKNCTAAYMKIIDNFMQEFQGESQAPKYNYVVLPRQKLENYFGNDRKYDMTDVLASLIEKNYIIYNTDDEHLLVDQIAAVRSAPVVIVTDGSPFMVNLMFGKNQHFLIVGRVTQDQQLNYPKKKYIIDTTCRLNGNSFEYKW